MRVMKSVSGHCAHCVNSSTISAFMKHVSVEPEPETVTISIETRKPFCRRETARFCHLGFDRPGYSAIRSTDPEYLP